MSPSNVEGTLAVARAALDAREFPIARSVLTPLAASPTQRIAILMAELEELEHADEGRARAWMARAVRARRDPAWTADGVVSDRWMPVSPVTGKLDAFQWRTPLAEVEPEVAMIEGKERMLIPALTMQPPAAAPRTAGRQQASMPAGRLHDAAVMNPPERAPAPAERHAGPAGRPQVAPVERNPGQAERPQVAPAERSHFAAGERAQAGAAERPLTGPADRLHGGLTPRLLNGSAPSSDTGRVVMAPAPAAEPEAPAWLAAGRRRPATVTHEPPAGPFERVIPLLHMPDDPGPEPEPQSEPEPEAAADTPPEGWTKLRGLFK
jgi:HemY protein